MFGSFVSRVRFASSLASGDVTAPVISTITVPVSGLIVDLVYDESLNTGSTPAPGDFALNDTAATVASVSHVTTTLTNDTIRLTLTSGTPIINTEIPSVDYTKGANPIEDTSGNDAANLSAESVDTNFSAAILPDRWDPLQVWDADDAVDGADFDWPSRQAASLVQTTDANEPAVSTDSNWNSKNVVIFGDSTDTIAVDTGDWSLASQRALHDGVADYYGHVMWEMDGSGTAWILDSTALGTGVGMELKVTAGGSATFLLRGTAGASIATVSVSGIEQDVQHLIEFYFDQSATEVGIALDGGPWQTSSVSGSHNTGDAAQSLAVSTNGITGRAAWIGLYSTIPAVAADRQERIDYFLGLSGIDTTADGWVDQYPVSANGAMYSPEDGTLSAFMNDLAGTNDLTTASNDPAVDASTYGSPVIDFNGTSHYLNLPTAFCSAITGTEDQPLSAVFGIRSEATVRILLESGNSGTDYPMRYLISGTATRQFRRRDSGAGDKTATSTGSFSANTWETNELYCDGVAVEFLNSGVDATSTSDVDVGATTGATAGRLGSTTSGTNFYDGQIGRLVLDDTYAQGMTRAKLQRWVDYYTQTL